MSTDFTNVLERAITSLVSEGKEPSVALVKSRLETPVPMPLIISALQRWKKSGTVPKVEMITKTSPTEARIAALEEQVAMLTRRLEELEQHSQ